jgi:hypothetical protein
MFIMNKTQEAFEMAIESMKELQGSVITYETNCGGYKCRELHCSACFDDDTVEEAINNSKVKVEKAYKAIQACKEALAEPKREWVGLSDEEVQTIFELGHHSYKEFAKAIEAKLKELNT